MGAVIVNVIFEPMELNFDLFEGDPPFDLSGQDLMVELIDDAKHLLMIVIESLDSDAEVVRPKNEHVGALQRNGIALAKPECAGIECNA